MVEIFDMKEIEKFSAALNRYCLEAKDGCNQCPLCGVICSKAHNQQLVEMASIVSEWMMEHPLNTKLTKEQEKYLTAFKALGLNYLAKDSYGDIFAYTVCPLKGPDYWVSIKSNINVSGVEKECFIALSPLCNWKDEKPLNIADSLKEKKAIYN